MQVAEHAQGIPQVVILHEPEPQLLSWFSVEHGHEESGKALELYQTLCTQHALDIHCPASAPVNDLFMLGALDVTNIQTCFICSCRHLFTYYFQGLLSNVLASKHSKL